MCILRLLNCGPRVSGVNEIDNRGKRLTGCMMCNIWWSADDKKVRLSEEDFGASMARVASLPAATDVDYDSSLCPKTFFSFFVTFIPIMFSIQPVTSGKHEFE